MKIKNLINKNFNYRILIYDCDNKNRAYKKTNPVLKLAQDNKKNYEGIKQKLSTKIFD